jgi:hypothetical protein
VGRVLPLLLCASVYQPIWAQSAASLDRVKRVYVGSFGSNAEAEQVRQAVIEDLRRHGKLRVADAAPESDATFTASGEVYVKGYYSLNPRARSVGEDAHPLYGGYLSVELRDRQKEVLWSYLVTPHRYGPQPIGRNLAMQIVKKLKEALTH